MIRKIPVESVVVLLVVIFVYTAASKILEAETFKTQMFNQPLPSWLTRSLIWLVPSSELLASVLLVIKPLRLYGLLLSLILMLAFTVYIGLILAGRFAFIPCSCGGIFKTLSWETHLIVNVFFTAIAVIGLFVQIKNHRLKTP